MNIIQPWQLLLVTLAGWIKRIARNVTDPIDGFLLGIRRLIMGHDVIFTAEFRRFSKREGVKAVRLPPRSPNLNAYAGRFVRTIKETCLDRVIFLGEDSLRRAINEFLDSTGKASMDQTG